MAKKQKQKIEFRYYKMPEGAFVLAMLGQKWEQNYGSGIDSLHFHNYLEIGYCYEGTGTLSLGEDIVPYENGTFTVIPKNYPHTTNSTGNSINKWEYLFIDLETLWRGVKREQRKQIELIMQRVSTRALIKKKTESLEISDKILHILNIMRKADEFYIEEAKGELISLMTMIARENRMSKEEFVEEDGRTSSVIYNVLDLISIKYMEPLRAEDLANWCHLSETHFRRVFTSYMKMTPMEYVNLIRIQAACNFLKKTDEQIADIAHKVGFATVSTFNRNFKQFMGVSPNEWRSRPEQYEQQILKFRVHSEEGW